MNGIVDLTIENFQQVILQDSQQKFVMVEFWAAESDELKPTLTKLAAENADTLIFARVNCDEQQQIAAQFGIRGLPTVILVKDGQPVDGFAGPHSEQQIREMLEKHLPKAEDGLYAEAAQLINQGDHKQAFPLIKQAYDIAPERADIQLAYADCCVELGNLSQAKSLLENIKLVDQDAYYQSILGKIDLAEQAAESPEIKALQEKVAQNPQDLQLKIDLAVQLDQANQTEDALQLLFSVLQQDLSFTDARKITLDVINALPDGEPLKSQYRRKIYSLLY